MSLSSRRAVNIRIGTSALVACAPDGAADRHAVDLRQHQIEHDDVEWLLGDQPERFLAVGGRGDRQPFQAQVELDKLADVRLVFDDQGSSLRRWRRHGHVQV